MAALIPDNSKLFINPYNFVSTTPQVKREPPGNGDLTGLISCRVIVKGELALPDHSDCEDRKYNFYNIAGKQIIPGSELKGCIRSVYESLTPSCFSVMNNNVLTKRLSRPDNNVVPGILRFERSGWAIYDAMKYKPQAWKGAPPDIQRNWPAFKGGKLKESLFIQSGSDPVYACSDDEIDRFVELLEIFKSYAKENVKSLFAKMIKQIENKEDVAIFYRLDQNNKLSYFSPAQVSRHMFQNTVASLLGEHSAGLCGKQRNGYYCPACALFGTLGGGNALASHVRFSDAVADSVTISDDYKNLPELSSPKVTSVEFYSKKGVSFSDVVSWNYDTRGVVLNGRKFYYHSEPKTEKTLGERSIAVKTALANSTFKFDIAFDRITEEQLRQLLWVLTIGENDENSLLCHKIGAGKPVGYGSVKIVVDNIRTRVFSGGEYGIENKTYDAYAVNDSIFCEPKALKEFRLISNYNYVAGKTVSYPIANDGTGSRNATAAHQWFSNNRTQGNNRQAAKFKYVLSPISENPDDLELPAMVVADHDIIPNTGGRGSDSSSVSITGDLIIGTVYVAKIIGSFEDRYGNFFFKLSVAGITEIGGKTCKINQKFVKNKSQGGILRVIYNGMNDRGIPQFKCTN